MGLDGTWTWQVVRVLVVVLGVAVVAYTGLRWSRGVSSRRAAFAQVALAAITLPAAGTIAIAYASKAGLSARSIGGFVATAGAIALYVEGVRTLIHHTHGWRRWSMAPIGLIGAFVGISTIFPAVYATNVPRPQLGSARPSDFAFDYVDVAFDTDDLVSLSGWYVPSTNGAAVVLVHGASSTRTSVLEQAVVLATHGYGVLAFDARGHGLSGGRAMEFGWYGERDVAAAVTYLRTRPDVDRRRIGVLGMSMGGESAIGALAADPRLAAAVAEGATNRVYGDKSWLADEYGLRGRIQLGIEWMTYQLTNALTEAKPPQALADSLRAAAPRPALLIAAGNVADERIVGERLRAASPGNVRLWVAEGADHTGALDVQPEEWTRQVTQFFDSTLLEQVPAQ